MFILACRESPYKCPMLPTLCHLKYAFPQTFIWLVLYLFIHRNWKKSSHFLKDCDEKTHGLSTRRGCPHILSKIEICLRNVLFFRIVFMYMCIVHHNQKKHKNISVYPAYTAAYPARSAACSFRPQTNPSCPVAYRLILQPILLVLQPFQLVLFPMLPV